MSNKFTVEIITPNRLTFPPKAPEVARLVKSRASSLHNCQPGLLTAKITVGSLFDNGRADFLISSAAEVSMTAVTSPFNTGLSLILFSVESDKDELLTSSRNATTTLSIMLL